MAAEIFDSFRAELAAINDRLSLASTKRTLRDDELLERIRNLFRTWVTTVRPSVQSPLNDNRDFFKLEAELQALAALTSKIKPLSDYRKRAARCLQLTHGLVLFLPPSGSTASSLSRAIHGKLFLPEIADLPVALVPNALLGWRSTMEAFLRDNAFDRSVFIMIRYRDRNRSLIAHIKRVLGALGYSGIVASDHNITDDLYNPIACLLCCAKGLAVFDEPESEQVGRRVEAVYALAAPRVGGRLDPSSPENKVAVVRAGTATLRLAAREFRAAIETDTVICTNGRANTRASRQKAWLTDEAMVRLHGLSARIEKLLTKQNRQRRGRLHALTIVLAPLVKKRRSSNA